VARRWWAIHQAPPAIYGTIICASVIGAGYDYGSIEELCVTVAVTVLIYWAAERWSQALGSHLQGTPLTWADVRRVFVRAWPMVQASYTPLLVMLAAHLFGASIAVAADIAMVITVLLLGALGATAGRRSGLAGWGVVASALFTGLLGLVLVALKALLH
jgi:hypothetical protein